MGKSPVLMHLGDDDCTFNDGTLALHNSTVVHICEYVIVHTCAVVHRDNMLTKGYFASKYYFYVQRLSKTFNAGLSVTEHFCEKEDSGIAYRVSYSV